MGNTLLLKKLSSWLGPGLLIGLTLLGVIIILGLIVELFVYFFSGAR
jgi:hypothetical protein